LLLALTSPLSEKIGPEASLGLNLPWVNLLLLALTSPLSENIGPGAPLGLNPIPDQTNLIPPHPLSEMMPS